MVMPKWADPINIPTSLAIMWEEKMAALAFRIFRQLQWATPSLKGPESKKTGEYYFQSKIPTSCFIRIMHSSLRL